MRVCAFIELAQPSDGVEDATVANAFARLSIIRIPLEVFYEKRADVVPDHKNIQIIVSSEYVTRRQSTQKVLENDTRLLSRGR